MDQERSDRLIEAFPRLYRNWQGRDMSKVLVTRYDFECGNGWFKLLWDLSVQLETLIAKLPKKKQKDYTAFVIKQKWGKLDFGMGYSTNEMDDLILSAWEQSSHICEVCGSPGALLLDLGYLVTRCTLHAGTSM